MTFSGKIAVLFPGQGSQYIGMGKEFVDNSADARQLMDMAESVSGCSLSRLCFEGPMEELTEAANLQPALSIANMLSWQALSKGGLQVDYLAGHSLGEYSALHAAGVLSFEDTIKLVAARGRIMGEAGAANPGGMAAILGMHLPEVEAIVDAMQMPDKISIGNHNSEQQIVLSGDKEVLAAACEIAEKKGGRAIALNVSIANHSPLMASAVPAFEEDLSAACFNAPLTPLLFNVTAAVENDSAAMKDIMARQIVSKVRWFDIINELVKSDVKIFIEAGPKKVLSGLMKRILPKGAGHKCYQVDTPEAVEKCLSEIG